jgi:hypothetical protein
MLRIAGAVAMAATLIAGLAGCYTLQVSAPGDVTNGTQVALDISDAGRLALGNSMGPGILQVEGRLMAKENDEYVVAVSAVKLLRGGEQVWKGERVSIRTEHVTRVYERRHSRGRSIAAGAAGAGALVYVLTRAIIGAGLGDEGVLPVDTLKSRRGPVRP